MSIQDTVKCIRAISVNNNTTFSKDNKYVIHKEDSKSVILISNEKTLITFSKDKNAAFYFGKFFIYT